jgi:hypothetical protein
MGTFQSHQAASFEFEFSQNQTANCMPPQRIQKWHWLLQTK